MRVVSLLPSATEHLALLGAENLLVGRSHACDHPRSIADRPVLTCPCSGPHSGPYSGPSSEPSSGPSEEPTDRERTCSFDAERLEALRPDLIVTSSRGEVAVDETALRALAGAMTPTPVVLSQNPDSIEAVYDDLLALGEAVERTDRADAALVGLRERCWSAVDYVNPYIEGPEVALLTSLSPLEVGGWWIPQLIESAGGRCGLHQARAKPRTIAPEELVAAMPERLIICPGAFDLRSARGEAEEIRRSRWWSVLPAVLDEAAVLVEGTAFTRPGPRLFDAFRWLVGWLNDRPELTPRGFPVRVATAVA